MRKYLGLDIKRLNRRSFFWTIIISAILFVSTGLLIDFLFRAIFGVHTKDGEPTLVFVPFIVLWWVYAASCAIRRLHDTDAMGWWSLAIVVPFANIILLIRLFLSKGSSAANRYGEPYNRTFLLGLGL
jgi:uncharacterized membrane protein YhaH (DUF805 family)